MQEAEVRRMAADAAVAATQCDGRVASMHARHEEELRALDGELQAELSRQARLAEEAVERVRAGATDAESHLREASDRKVRELVEAYDVKLRSEQKSWESERERAAREARSEAAQLSEALAAEQRRHATTVEVMEAAAAAESVRLAAAEAWRVDAEPRLAAAEAAAAAAAVRNEAAEARVVTAEAERTAADERESVARQQAEEERAAAKEAVATAEAAHARLQRATDDAATLVATLAAEFPLGDVVAGGLLSGNRCSFATALSHMMAALRAHVSSCEESERRRAEQSQEVALTPLRASVGAMEAAAAAGRAEAAEERERAATAAAVSVPTDLSSRVR